MGVKASAVRSSIPDTPNSVNSAVNASLVGANTVNGPVPESVPTKSALVNAATRILKVGLFTAISTIDSGKITSTYICCIILSINYVVQ